MKKLALWVLALYKRWISPSLPPSCRYVPTCSEYATEAVERFGFIRGGMMSAWRLLRCHPFVKGGYDPVVAQPSSISGTLHNNRGVIGKAITTGYTGSHGISADSIKFDGSVFQKCLRDRESKPAEAKARDLIGAVRHG